MGGMQAGKGKKPHKSEQIQEVEKKALECIKAEATEEARVLKHFLEYSKQTQEEGFFVSITEIHLPEESPGALKRRRFAQSLLQKRSKIVSMPSSEVRD